MTEQRFAELVSEYEDHLIGEEIYGLLHELAEMLARRYKSPIYNLNRDWDESSIDELCQEAIANQLLAQGQLHRIFETSDSLDALRGALFNQLKRAVIARKRKTPIDRLVARVNVLATEGFLEKKVVAGQTYFYFSQNDSSIQRLSSAQINRCVKKIQGIPILTSRLESSRESMIYGPAALKEVITGILDIVSGICVSDLYAVFENVLTPWTPTSLVPIDEVVGNRDSTNDGEWQDGQMTTDAHVLVEALSVREQLIFMCKCQNLSDSQIADYLEISRPTVADLKVKVFEKIRKFSMEYPDTTHETIVQIILERCSELNEVVQ